MKRKNLFFVFASLIIGTAVLFSCQKDEMSIADEGLSIKAAVPCNVLPTFDPLPDCEASCLEDGPYVQGTVSFVRQWAGLNQFPGYYKNNKFFTTKAWNDEMKFYVKVDVFGYQYDQSKVGGVWTLFGPTCDTYPFESVIITVDGIPYTYSMDDPLTTEVIETATTFTQDFPLPENWEKCNEIEYTVRIEGDGAPVWLGTEATPAKVTYTLFAPCVCETELTGQGMCGTFDYDDNTYNRKAIYTFSSELAGKYKIQGGLTNFTSDVIVLATVGSTVTVEPGGSSNHRITATGDIAECGEVIITVYWNSTNGDEYITGDWSVELNGEKILLIDELTCDSELTGYSPPTE